MFPESDQCRSLRTAVAGIPSKNSAFTLKKGNTCLFFIPVNQFQSNWLNKLTEVGYIISRSVSVIDNFGRLIEFGRLIAEPYMRISLERV